MQNSYQHLLLERQESIQILTIHRPKVLNALNEEVIDELCQVVESLSHDTGVRGLILTGSGEKSFVAGADIAAMAEMDCEQAMALSGRGHALGEMLANLPIPVIAAVNGYAFGGGCELALACDFIYASEKAEFGQPEVKLGVIPGFGGTQRLLRRVGLARALELCMTGRTVKAEEALRIGLVNRLVPGAELLPTAIATAQQIAANGPLAVAKVKELIHHGAELTLTDANHQEIDAFSQMFATRDQKEGMTAFLAKRKAQFTAT